MRYVSLWRLLFRGETEVYVSPKLVFLSQRITMPILQIQNEVEKKVELEDMRAHLKRKKISKYLWMEAHRKTERFLKTSILFTLHWATLTVKQKLIIQVPEQLDY